MSAAKPLFLFLFSETPVFPGAERGVTVDLVIQRDLLTGLPIIRASSIKGVFRSFCELVLGNSNNFCDEVFGSPDKASMLLFLDAHVLLFPVKSPTKFMVFLTSPYVLNRFTSLIDLAVGNIEKCGFRLKSLYDEVNNFIKNIDNIPTKRISIFDGDYSVEVFNHQQARDVISRLINLALPALPYLDYIRNKMLNDTYIVKDDSIFRDIINRGLERVTRIRLDYKKKVVMEGHLFTQELIPANTVFFSAIFIRLRGEVKDYKCKLDEIKNKLIRVYRGKSLSFGGDETVGKGFIRINLIDLGDV